MDLSFDAYYHQYTSPVPLCSLAHVGLRALDLEELEENGSVFMLANSPASCSTELSSDLLHDEEFVYFGNQSNTNTREDLLYPSDLIEDWKHINEQLEISFDEDIDEMDEERFTDLLSKAVSTVEKEVPTTTTITTRKRKLETEEVSTPMSYLKSVKTLQKTVDNIDRLKLYRVDCLITHFPSKQLKFLIRVPHSSGEIREIRAIRQKGITYFCGCDVYYPIIGQSENMNREIRSRNPSSEYMYVRIAPDAYEGRTCRSNGGEITFVTFIGLLTIIRHRLPGDEHLKRGRPSSLVNVIECNEMIQELTKYNSLG